MQIFIPRISTSLSREFVIDAFKRLSIGDITTIEIRSKSMIYENAPYGFAFITLNPFCSPIGIKLKCNLENGKTTRVYYNSSDVMSYWEFKPYIESMSKFPPLKIKPQPIHTQHPDPIFNNTLTLLNYLPSNQLTSYTLHSQDENDFYQLSRDIDSERESYYSHWTTSYYVKDHWLCI